MVSLLYEKKLIIPALRSFARLSLWYFQEMLQLFVDELCKSCAELEESDRLYFRTTWQKAITVIGGIIGDIMMDLPEPPVT